ncbi:MAG TPA: hypothetical protein VGS41_07295, partial [Chthonomonadales bacterium]|nr:hypothetical protein [Chthonomonadales bacterium]
MVSALCCKPTLGQNAEVTLESQFQPVAGYHLYANMWASGNLAVIGSDQTNGVLIVDITNPLQPVELADYSPANSADMEDVQISGTVGFFASNTDDGVHLVDLSNPSNPTLITRLSSSQNGFDHIHNLFVDSNNTLYEADELTPVVKVFDVSNPANPVWLADITTHDKFVVASITVQNNRLYTAGWGGTTDIYDVTNIKTQPPVWLGSIASGFGTHSCWPTADGAYLAVTREVLNGDVRIYNISNPSSPVLVADLFPSTFGITAAAPSNPWIVGNRLYLSWDQAGVVVLDISNPSAPALLGTYCTWSGPYNPSMYDGAWGIAPALSASQVMATDRNGGMFTVDTSSSGSQLVPFSIILPAGVRPGATATGTVYLCGGPAPAGGAAINLSVNSSSAVVRNSVTIPQGSNRANFWIKGAISVTTPTPVTVTATYNGVAAAGSTTITPPSLESVVFTSTSIAGGAGGSATGKVLFSAPVASSTVVSLNVASGASAVSALPATVTVPAGATGASFTMSTTVVAAPIDVSVTGTAGTVSQTGQVSVTPPTAVSLSASPNPVIGGRAANLTINLSDTATAPVTVSLTSYCRQITFAGGGS